MKLALVMSLCQGESKSTWVQRGKAVPGAVQRVLSIVYPTFCNRPTIVKVLKFLGKNPTP